MFEAVEDESDGPAVEVAIEDEPSEVLANADDVLSVVVGQRSQSAKEDQRLEFGE